MALKIFEPKYPLHITATVSSFEDIHALSKEAVVKRGPYRLIIVAAGAKRLFDIKGRGEATAQQLLSMLGREQMAGAFNSEDRKRGEKVDSDIRHLAQVREVFTEGKKVTIRVFFAA